MPDEIKPILEAILSELRALREQAGSPPKEWLTVKDMAVQLGLAEKTIRNRISSKQFPIKHRKVGGRVLFRAEDLRTL